MDRLYHVGYYGSMDESGIRFSDLLIDGIYAFVITVNIYMIVDEATDGALTKAVEERWNRLRENLTRKAKIERKVRKQFPWVLWEATEIVEDKREAS